MNKIESIISNRPEEKFDASKVRFGINLLKDDGSLGFWLSRRGDYDIKKRARTWKKKNVPIINELKRQRKLYPDTAHKIVIHYHTV